MTEPTAISATGIVKRFGSSVAVDDADLVVPRGAIVALLGPSGSGKTTLLRIVAGFERPDEGTVAIGDRLVAGPGTWVEPEERRIGMVFQDGALFPHLTVARNVAFGGPAPGRGEECLALVGLAHRGDAYPHELSGGERQRVALARALATDPEVVLLDEPFASLDAALRVALREQVAEILREAGATALLVTHDQQEALSLADEVVLLRDGRVEQAGPPEVVYDRPASTWVAGFLGAAEIVPGTAADGTVRCELGSFAVDGSVQGDVVVVIRPEALRLATGDGVTDLTDTDPADTDTGTPAAVVGRSFFGHDQLVVVELHSGRRLHSRTAGSAHWRPGDRVRVHVDGSVGVLPAS